MPERLTGGPRQSLSRRAFETWYGAFYDAAVQSPHAPLGARLMWGADARRMLDAVTGAVACQPGEVVLDCPAGGGVAMSRGLPHTEGLLVGMDLSALMLGRAARLARALPRRQRSHVALLRGDATRLPLADGAVDRVACFNSLHCVPAHAAVLREFRRVLRPGGELVGTVLTADAPLPWLLSVRAARLSGFFVPPDSKRLAAAARRAGFKVWETARTGALLFFRAT